MKRADEAAASVEPALDPDLPIIDAHHHLWSLPKPQFRRMLERDEDVTDLLAPPYRAMSRYLADDFAADAAGGHRVVGSVFVEVGLNYDMNAPPDLRPVGEVAYVADQADALDGLCAGIVGRADLSLGERVEDVLQALVHAGRGRLKGVRMHVAHDADTRLSPAGRAQPRELSSYAFRRGFARLAPYGLAFDAYVYEPQLPELTDLARSFPNTVIVLDHVGCPLGIGSYWGRRRERFALWEAAMRELARSPRVVVKLGGLGMAQCGFLFDLPRRQPHGSQELASFWAPYIETCIDLFGVDRCMFESNFPVDAATCGYITLWNTFKRIVEGASPTEKQALFHGTANAVYKLGLAR